MQILAPSPGTQVGAQCVPRAGSENIPDRPMITSSLLKRKRCNSCLETALTFLGSEGALPGCRSSAAIATEK